MPQTYDINLPKLIDQFHSEDKCRSYLDALRWPDGVTCPRCAASTVSKVAVRMETGGTPSRKELHGFIGKHVAPDPAAIYMTSTLATGP